MSFAGKQVVVVAGPSGGGKNSILDAIVERCKRCSRLVTATTRPPRPGEVNGVDYHFLTDETFMRALEAGDILEHRDVRNLGTHYGIYKPDLDERLARGEIVLAHLDIVGARYLKEHYGALTIFIMPDSFEVLESRVRTRNPGMSDAEVLGRMEIAKREINEDAKEYDHTVINAHGKLEQAVEDVIAILRKEGYTLE